MSDTSFPVVSKAADLHPSRWRLARAFACSLPPRGVALLLALWCTLFLNQAWWRRLSALAAEQRLDVLQQLVVAAVLTAASYLWLMLLSWPGLRKLGWSVTLLVAAAVQYFMLRYGVVMDAGMVRNTLQTNASEGLALVSSGLLWHVLWYAVVPLAWLWCGVQWPPTRWRHDGWRSAIAVVAALAVVMGGGLWLYKPMAPLVRNHTEIRYLLNPLATVTSVASVTLKPWFKRPRPFQTIAQGAGLGESYVRAPVQAASVGVPLQHKPPLLVLVVGETTRADHFGLNGYPRDTTPQLQARNVVSWPHVQSCGTNTLASVPCMFSHLGKAAFEDRRAEYENLLDVLQHAGLRVDWLDNQAGCKAVCNRISHAQADQVASAQLVQQWCRYNECLDQLMVELLDQRLHTVNPQGDAAGTVLVLHQMGSHGPAYYRRSSPANKRFQPECTTHVTSDCSRIELVNVYDNSMLETDQLVARTIDWLQAQQDHYEVGLMYLADHGESLGENGLYLHGLPYMVAPDVQKQVPWVLWPGSLLVRTAVVESCVRAGVQRPLTHDFFYHTVLGLLDVQTPTYQPALDALAHCRQPQGAHAV